MYVINTRPAPDADAYSIAIKDEGAAPVLSPVLVIRFRDQPVVLAEGEAVAFTSANGVRAFARTHEGRTTKAFAVGAATAAELRRAGFVDVETGGGDVESLVDLIASSKRALSILHLAGSDRAGDLVAALVARGVRARRLVLYDALPAVELTPEARRLLTTEPQNCAVGLFSPRSAALFLEQSARAGVEGQLAKATLMALSAAVAAAARPNSWGAVKVAPERTLEGMAALIHV